MKIQERLIKLKTDDGVIIAVWKVFHQNKNKNIFLTHGTFSNKKIFSGIVNYLVNLGYTCWIMEWRNHGESTKTKRKFNFETIGLYDIKTTFNYLIHTLGIKKLNCITHSGGGISLSVFLLKNTMYIDNIDTITMFNCQSFGAVNSKKAYLKIWLSKYISYVLGYIPGIKLGLGVHNETYFTMKQWFDWNLKQEFKGADGFNYLEKMNVITLPILSICAEGDRFIAPKEGCEKFIKAFNNQNNKFIVCSMAHGFKEDYDHSRTILSKNASKEIWDIVLKWIENTTN